MGFLGLGGAAPCRQVVGGSPPGAGRWALVLTGLVCSAHTAMSAVYKFCLGFFSFADTGSDLEWSLQGSK